MTAPTPAAKSYYELLGVSYYASPDDVRKGCERRLAALDRMRAEGADDDLPEQAQARRDIITAYLALKDGARRNAYNAALAAANAETAAARARENNAGLTAPGWGGVAPARAQTSGPLSPANTPAAARANDLLTSQLNMSHRNQYGSLSPKEREPAEPVIFG